VSAAYLAPEGFEEPLAQELGLAGARVVRRHGRLLVTDAPPVPAAWSANTWQAVEALPVRSIADAASQLRQRQRSWAVYAPQHRGRSRLVEERLPHVSARPLAWGALAPAAPLGSWTFLTPELVLAAATCTSPFPNGEPAFEIDRFGPPSRAYLKLWEAFVRLGCYPQPGERCLDLGASPGGWSWLLARNGSTVLAVDKAPLDPAVAALPNVTWLQQSAFALDPSEVGAVDWWCSDIVAYPARILSLVERWWAAGAIRHLVCTIKFQGTTDHEVGRRFAALTGGEICHLHHNKHELTVLARQS
jgi:23S rRNA (cytidine2498-2'-O)-methyltransferase